MGLAHEERTQDLLRSTFKLVGEGSEVSEKHIMELRQKLVKQFLIGLPGYGNVVLRMNKTAFEKSVENLRKSIDEFQNLVRGKLQKEMDANRRILLAALTPSVTANPPERWTKFLGPHPSEDDVRGLLEKELIAIFGSVDHIFSQMTVKLVFKGVTYELLRDPNFIETAQKKMPGLKILYEEFGAAKANKPRPSPTAV